MPLTGRYRAVIFDMDGLLLDTEGLWDRAEGELFRRHGDAWTFEDKLAVMGAPGIAAAKAAGLTCIAVPQFAETDVSSADRVVSSLEELLVAGDL